jgi:hypothetical protein
LTELWELPEELQAEIAWLRYFYGEADFGPADDDVRYYIAKDYVKAGNCLPKDYDSWNLNNEDEE